MSINDNVSNSMLALKKTLRINVDKDTIKKWF